LFRLVDERAIINRMGFNNHGSEALAERLKGLRTTGQWPDAPVGANLGKSKVTPLDDAVNDYVTSTLRLRGLVDWFTVNVSSPNTPGLRELQDGEALRRLLPAVVTAAAGTPVWLKLAPDLGDEALASAVGLAREAGVRAVVATNTTLRRDLLRSDPLEAGGLSGRPLHAFALDRVRVVVAAAGRDVDVIGVGGIESAEHASEFLGLGCAAVQLYTAFVYEGPALPGRIQRELLRRS
jgi:dihydroorotate dehydrogenase